MTSYEGLQKFALAEKCYRKAVMLKPKSYVAAADLGDILRKQNKFEEARKWLLHAKDLLEPNSDSKFVDKCLSDCSVHLKDSSP